MDMCGIPFFPILILWLPCVADVEVLIQDVDFLIVLFSLSDPEASA